MTDENRVGTNLGCATWLQSHAVPTGRIIQTRLAANFQYGPDGMRSIFLTSPFMDTRRATEGSAVVLDSTSRSPTERNAVDTGGFADAVES
jgi:hypothetical protein